MQIIFWASLAVIVWVYAGYPLTLAIIAVLCARPTKRDDKFLPTVSLVIAAYNEEKVLEEKLQNSLALDYPKDLLEIVVASDGSIDSTNEIAKAYADTGIILHEITPRGGKTRALNIVIPKTQGEILVLSDANPIYRPDALRKLVRHFVDPTVGVVSGDVRLVDAAETHAESEGLYYRYERRLQSLESRVGSVIGADGGMYAIRRGCFRPPSDSMILDDFIISMTAARLGHRVLYEPDAIAIEQGTLNSREEFRRKVRIVSGGIQALKSREGLPCLTQPLLLLSYMSHKLFRWMVPCFLLMLFVSSLLLQSDFPYRLALIGQVLFYLAALAYATNLLGARRIHAMGVPFYFALVNSAALLGIWRGFLYAQKPAWNRTSR